MLSAAWNMNHYDRCPHLLPLLVTTLSASKAACLTSSLLLSNRLHIGKTVPCGPQGVNHHTCTAHSFDVASKTGKKTQIRGGATGRYIMINLRNYLQGRNSFLTHFLHIIFEPGDEQLYNSIVTLSA